MEKTALMVIAYDRPPFLYITLSAVFKMQGIMDCPVYVFVDKVSPDLQECLRRVLADFPVAQVVFRAQRLNIRWNLLLGLRHLFEIGFERVIYIEEDHLMRSDALLKIEETVPNGFFLALSIGGRAANEYCVLGNVITKKNFAMVYEWVRNRKFIGEEVRGWEGVYYSDIELEGVIYRLTNYDTDYIFRTFLDVHNLESEYIGELLVAHFGIIGANFGKTHEWVHNGTLMANVGWALSTIFRGDKSEWLDNVASLFNDGIIPVSLLRVFFPGGFKYF